MATATSDRGGDKRLALVAAVLGSSIVALDATVVNVALPAIERDLGGGLAGQQWVSNAYLLTLSALILVSGSLADLLGERRIFVLGVGGFGVTSVLCAAAPTVEFLIAARALQGVSGALLTPAALAIIIAVFPERERGAAVGTWTAWGGMGYMLGPLIGGQIVDVASWRWIFLLNLPLVAGTLLLAARAVPGRERAPGPVHIDVLGAVLAGAGLAGISFALIQQPLLGWASPGIWGPLAGGALLLVAFVVVEARVPAPMLPLGLFRRRNFAIGNAQTFAMYGALGLFGFFLTLFLQQVAGFSALEAGTTSLVPTLVMFALSRRFGALADRHGPKLFMSVGPLVSALGLALLLRLDADVDYLTELLPALLCFSLGLAITVSPLTAAVLADADAHNAGIASAVNNAVARTAGLVAVAAVGAVVAGQFSSSLDGRLARIDLPGATSAAVEEAKRRTFAEVATADVPAEARAAVLAASKDASVSAFHLAVGVGSGMLAVAGLVGAVGLRNPGRVDVRAQECAGGCLTGAPVEATGDDARPLAVAEVDAARPLARSPG